tara:strand:+ start:756 stop:1010 length:255 start_codon:yes stop_codon:yes gene_type:complete
MLFLKNNRKLNETFLLLCMIFNIMSSSTTIIPITTNTTKVVPIKKNKKKKNNKRSKSKIQDDLDRLRKSRQFRDLGDALDYFSD